VPGLCPVGPGILHGRGRSARRRGRARLLRAM